MRRSLMTSAVLALLLVVPGSVAMCADGSPADKSADTKSAPASAGATREEVQQLRDQVAAQQQTIEQLKAMVQRLAQDQKEAGEAKVVNASQSSAEPRVITAAIVTAEPIEQAAKSGEKKAGELPLTAGWNGEHFFIKSPDGAFQLQPYGYVNTDYRAYSGAGAPSDTFVLRRARFGFQGNYGSHFQFAMLLDAASSSGAIIRDVYINIQPIKQFQVQAGQFKVPFGQEAVEGVTNIDFVERGLQALIYASASSAYRSPGVTVHGDLLDARVQYWLGAFNGKGFSAVNTTNEPEVIGRLRFYPWRSRKDSVLQGFAFGGAIDHGRTRGLSREQSFNGGLPDAAYNFFPSFVVNGDIWRYNGEFTWVQGPWGLRGEYNQLQQNRDGVGALQVGGVGFQTLPAIRAKAWNLSGTWLLTGEKRPENGTPKVKRPFLGPDTPGLKGRGLGAWEVAFRYSGIQGKEPGIAFNSNLTPNEVATFNNHTDEFTWGINWYPNYWVRYMLDFNLDRLKEPSVTGALPGNYFVLLQRLQFRF